MKLLIIRHGDPDYEKDSLTKTGWREAELLANRLETMDIAAFYVSPLGRAQDTASCTLTAMHRTAETLDWLQEFPLHRMDAICDFYCNSNANPMRGFYPLSLAATEAYENSRARVARFIGAENPSEVIFTRNASESLNLVAYTYGLSTLKAGDEVAVSILEHPRRF